MKKFFADFKEFAMKGNVVDMAIGVVVGGAFSKIVSSFVADVITPLLSLLLGEVNLTELKWIMRPALLDGAGEVIKAEVALTYGSFLQNIIDFLLIALSIFIVMRVMFAVKAKLARKPEAPAEEPKPAPETELEVLGQIRDLLKEQQPGEKKKSK